MQENFGVTAVEFIAQRMAPTKVKLLAVAIEEAIKRRNTTLIIFLLKNLCGFSDRKEVKQEISTNAEQSSVSIVLPSQVQSQLKRLEELKPKEVIIQEEIKNEGRDG